MHATNQEDALKRAYLRGNRIYLWLIVNHFDRIHRAYLGAGTTADAFI